VDQTLLADLEIHTIVFFYDGHGLALSDEDLDGCWELGSAPLEPPPPAAEGLAAEAICAGVDLISLTGLSRFLHAMAPVFLMGSGQPRSLDKLLPSEIPTASSNSVSYRKPAQEGVPR
jgi:hypothetical protein